MVTFANNIERRCYGTSKDVLSAKEAAMLYMAAAEKGQINSAYRGHLKRMEIEDTLGPHWEKKLQKIILSKPGEDIYFDSFHLTQIAKAPISASELAALVVTHFKGAVRAMNFIRGRMKHPELEQTVAMSEEFVKKTLGPLWRDRLAAAGVSYAH